MIQNIIFDDYTPRITFKRVPGLRDIARSVAEDHDIELELLLDVVPKTAWLVRLRQEFYWRAHRTGRFSLPRIAAFLGQDHTTVLHAVRRHQARLNDRKAHVRAAAA